MLGNALNLAQREIRRNVLRSSLTTLGIIIGVSAVIIMVTLGNGATAAVTADIANLGSNLLTVMPGQRVGPGGASGGAKPFKQRDVELLRRDVTSVGAVAPLSSQGMSAVVGNKNRSLTVTGTTNELLVGGIGIMNIMLVSVTERTREIGIRLAIGALERDVLTQFLVEAVVLSAFGGVIGVSFALVVSSLGARALGLPWVLDVKIVLLALLFSAGVGVVFGFFPARRAASLNPIDALRHE